MRTDEEEWQQIGMCEADDDGCYGDEWETEETGIYVVNATYLGSEGLRLNPVSTRLSVVVEPAEEDVFAATNSTIIEVEAHEEKGRYVFTVSGEDGTVEFADHGVQGSG